MVFHGVDLTTHFKRMQELVSEADKAFLEFSCGIGSCGVPRPRLAPYVPGTGPMDRVTAAETLSTIISF